MLFGVWVGRPMIRSMPTLAKPASPAISTAADALGGAVGPFQETQVALLEGLRADAQAVDAGAAPSPQPGRRQVVGVGFQGDLGALGGPEMFRGGFQDPRHLVRLQQRGRAAADIHAVEGEARVAAQAHFAPHLGEIRRRPVPAGTWF